jgi:hypothetical protein
MKFHSFLESNYVTTNRALQEEYSPSLQARINAIQALINCQKTILRWLSYPVLLVGYLSVLLGLKDAPKTAQELVNAMQKEAVAKAEALAEANRQIAQDVAEAAKNAEGQTNGQFV